MKNSFMVMALRCIDKTISSFVSQATEGAKYLLLDDVIAFSELSSRYRWLVLTSRYQYTLKVKNKMPINNLHVELMDLLKSYPELDGYDVSQGDPFVYLINERGITLDEMIKLHGEHHTCVPVDALEEVITAVCEYNFYYKYKKLFHHPFKFAEKKMQELSKRDHYPGRGSWNSFVPKSDKPKTTDVNLDFLRMYAPKPDSEGGKKNDDDTAKPSTDQKGEEPSKDNPKPDPNSGELKDEDSGTI